MVTSRLGLLLCGAVMLGIGLGACTTGVTPSPTPSPSPGTTDTLTEAEQQALDTALASVSSLAYANDSTQAATDTSGVETLDLLVCPDLSLEVEDAVQLAISASLEFGSNGAGCTPVWMPGTTCSGSASASLTYGATGAHIEMEYAGLTCGDAILDGFADLAYDRAASDLTLDGEWDITLTDAEGTYRTNGTGECGYDLGQYASSVLSFDGTATGPDGTWDLLINETLTMSYAQYLCYMPFSGQIVVSGVDIRDLTLRFAEDSPATGIIEISVANAPFFPWEIDTVCSAGS